MAARVVSLGLACADVMVKPVDALPERGKLSLVPKLEIHLGGLAAVTGSVLETLGVDVAFVGRLGDDGFGNYILGALKAAGVDTSSTHIVEGEESPATVVLISEDGERTFLHHMGSATTFSEAEVDFDVIRQAELVHWGGPAVTPGLDGEPIGRVLAKARDCGVKTSMDTCYDGAGKWFDRIEHALPHLNIVMSSIEEARMYTGKQTPAEIAEFYLSFGPETVMIKLGDEGVYVTDGSSSHQFAAHAVDVVDTTGAGDAACAGFLYGYLQEWELERSARLANAVGALTVQHMGGAEAITSLQQVLSFMSDCAVS